MADVGTKKLIKEFLTKNFSNLVSDNELGALKNLTSESDIMKEFGVLPKYNITGDDLKNVFENKFRAKDLFESDPSSFASGFTRLKGEVRDPLKDFSVSGEVVSMPNNPTLVNDASILQGKTVMPFVGDRTIANSKITRVGNLILDKPVYTHGGAQFADKTDAFWASMQGVMTGKQGTLETVDVMGGKPVGMTMTMGERSSDFSEDTANLFIEMLKVKKNTKKNLSELTNSLKNKTYSTINKDTMKQEIKQPFKTMPDFNKIEEFEKYFKSLPGTTRATFIKEMDSAKAQNLGAPNIGQLRLALTNPGLTAEDWLGMGARFADLDPKRGVLPSAHPTYRSQLMKAPNADTFTFGTTVPHNLMLRKIYEQRRAEQKYNKKGEPLYYGYNKPAPADYKTIEMKPSRVEVIDQQNVDEVSKYLQIKKNLGDRDAYEYLNKLIPSPNST